jgi:hypothetical protein
MNTGIERFVTNHPVVAVEGLLGFCSTCSSPMITKHGVVQNEVIEIAHDDDGRRWIVPHKSDCPRGNGS